MLVSFSSQLGSLENDLRHTLSPHSEICSSKFLKSLYSGTFRHIFRLISPSYMFLPLRSLLPSPTLVAACPNARCCSPLHSSVPDDALVIASSRAHRRPPLCSFRPAPLALLLPSFSHCIHRLHHYPRSHWLMHAIALTAAYPCAHCCLPLHSSLSAVSFCAQITRLAALPLQLCSGSLVPPRRLHRSSIFAIGKSHWPRGYEGHAADQDIIRRIWPSRISEGAGAHISMENAVRQRRFTRICDTDRLGTEQTAVGHPRSRPDQRC
jgi:hypothetical protein